MGEGDSMRNPGSMPRTCSRRPKLCGRSIKVPSEGSRREQRLRASSGLALIIAERRRAPTPPLQLSKVCKVAYKICVKRAAREVASTRVQTPKCEEPTQCTRFVPHLSASVHAHTLALGPPFKRQQDWPNRKLWALELGPGMLCEPRTVGSKFRFRRSPPHQVGKPPCSTLSTGHPPRYFTHHSTNNCMLVTGNHSSNLNTDD
jgi:hypothetical protein